jgi:hypothetical protein
VLWEQDGREPPMGMELSQLLLLLLLSMITTTTTSSLFLLLLLVLLRALVMAAGGRVQRTADAYVGARPLVDEEVVHLSRTPCAHRPLRTLLLLSSSWWSPSLSPLSQLSSVTPSLSRSHASVSIATDPRLGPT